MALNDTSKIFFSIKKLVGKAQTSNDKDIANEALPTGLTLANTTIFGQSIPTNVGSDALYDIIDNAQGEGVVEYLRLSASYIQGTDTSDGRHGFSVQLPDDYETNSTNPKKGTYPFLNEQQVYITSGSLQLIPASFATNYEAIPYHTGSGETQIPVLDARDWIIDYFNGIFFQQDPPGTGDNANNPRYVDAYLYIGEYSNKGIFSLGLSGSLTQLTDGTSYLAAGTNVTITSSSNGQILIESTAGGGTPGGSDTQVQFNDAGSFGGDSSFLFNKTTNSLYVEGVVTASLGFTGSLTRLIDGTSFIEAGSNITVTSASNGSVIITSTSPFTRVKTVQKVTSRQNSNTIFTVTGSDMSVGGFDDNYIDLFVNGQLLSSGTTGEVSSEDADYTINNSNELKFAFNVERDDVVSLFVYPKS